MKAYQELKDLFQHASSLQDIQRMMMWDEAVMMPEGAGAARAESVATLNVLIQKMLTNRKIQTLINAAKQEENLSDWDQANLEWIEKRYIRAKCIPVKLTEKFTRETLACEQSWRKLRAQNNWKAFLPGFKRVFKCVREIAKRYGDAIGKEPYEAMLDEYAPGFNRETIDGIFAGLKKQLPGLIQQVRGKQENEKVKHPHGPFAIAQQKELGIKVMRALQFDFNHGRLDVSHHPFCGGTPYDVRLTTRYNDHEFMSSLLGICHETGHGLYEQHLPREWIAQPVGAVNSMAMHESQSLIVEMDVCLSDAFYQYLLPELQHYFGQQDAFTADNMHKLVTRVTPDYIRVDADEVTYPMHVILRYELEKSLFDDEIGLQDLPAFWDKLMKQYLGISTKGNDKDGVMQDVHWPSGAFGYFPAYTLGRLIAAQLFATFIKTNPNFYNEVKSGQFQTLIQWLNENVYSKGSKTKTLDLIHEVTGRPLDSSYFIDHVRRRYL